MDRVGSACVVRPIFHYNAPQLIGDSISLHLFEPRYRLMVRRVLRTHNEFVYLGDGAYAPAVGAVGLVCRITESKMLPDGRALIVGLFTHRILITAAWTEESSGGLSYCAGLIRLPDGMPWLEELVGQDQVRPALHAFLSAKWSLMRDPGHQYMVLENTPVYPVLPMFNEHNRVVVPRADGILEVGDVVRAHLILPTRDEPPVLRASVEEPPGFCIAAAMARQFLQPVTPHLLAEGAVVPVFSVDCAAVVLLGGSSNEQQRAVQQLRDLAPPELRLVLRPVPSHDTLPLETLCRRIIELTGHSSSSDVLPPPPPMSQLLEGLQVWSAFGMPLFDVDARVAHVPAALPPAHMRALAREWQQALGVELRDDTPHPNVPFFVAVRIEESMLHVHHAQVLLYRRGAMRMLRLLSHRLTWPALRLLFIGRADDGSCLSLLPPEVALRIAHLIAPESFGIIRL